MIKIISYQLLKNLSTNFKSLLFSFNIFFWGITYSTVQLRFLILLLIVPIFISCSKQILSKFLKYFLFAILLLLHLFFQSKTFALYNILSILGLLFFLIILDTQKTFFFENLNKIIFIFLTVFLIYIVINFYSYDDYFKQVSGSCIGCFSILRKFFNENSHLALMAIPTIFYLTFISNYNKYLNLIYLILFLLICFVNPSLTLYVGVISLFLFILFFKIQVTNFNIVIILILLSFALIKLSVDNSSRDKVLDFFKTKNDINLSTEVYQTSLLVAKNAILHKPFGYGFNNYNEAFDQFAPDIKVYNQLVILLNKKDASNNFSKIVTEFGIFSFFFFYFLISFLINKKINKKIKIFLMLPILIQTFIRGVGYFNGGFILFLILAFIIWRNTRSKKNLLND
jgi:hypothetical protein